MKTLKPWTNVQLKEETNKFIVDVWGRTYTFENSLLPTSIIASGEELLHEPITMNLEFEKGPEKIINIEYCVFEKSEGSVTIVSSALCGNLVLNATITVEFDGYMNIAFKMTPPGTYCLIPEIKESTVGNLSKVHLSMKLNKKQSSLFHWWPAGENSTAVTGNVMNSGKFRNLEKEFKPNIWVGNEYRGLCFCIESEKNITLADKNKYMILKECDDYNEITINLLAKYPSFWEKYEERWLSTREPLVYDLIFQATPVKKYDKDLEENWRVVHSYYYEDMDFEEIARSGAKWVIFHEEWSQFQNYCYPRNERDLRDKIDECHKHGLKVMLYFGYEMSNALPHFEKNMDNYLLQTAKGTHAGGWTRQGTYQKAFIVCYNGGYSQEMIDNCVKSMEEYGTDGIYTDGTYIPWSCANENHGCGYRDDEGNLHEVYPIKALREHCKKLYTAIHEHGGIIDTHQSATCVMPTLAFCDTYYDGESIQGKFATDLDKFLDLDAVRCEYMGKNFGLIPNFINYLKPPHYTIENVLSVCLIHNVIPRPFVHSLPTVSKIWRTYDAFGTKTADWNPYWENNASVSVDMEKVYISTFDKNGRTLAIISNFNEGDVDVELKLNGEYKNARDIFTDTNYEVTNNSIKIKLKRAISYLLWIE